MKLHPYYPSQADLARALAQQNGTELSTEKSRVSREKPASITLALYAVHPETGALVAVGEWEWVETPGKFLNQEKQENGI